MSAMGYEGVSVYQFSETTTIEVWQDSEGGYYYGFGRAPSLLRVPPLVGPFKSERAAQDAAEEVLFGSDPDNEEAL